MEENESGRLHVKMMGRPSYTWKLHGVSPEPVFRPSFYDGVLLVTTLSPEDSNIFPDFLSLASQS